MWCEPTFGEGSFQTQLWALWKALPLEFAAALQSEFIQAILVALLIVHWNVGEWDVTYIEKTLQTCNLTTCIVVKKLRKTVWMLPTVSHAKWACSVSWGARTIATEGEHFSQGAPDSSSSFQVTRSDNVSLRQWENDDDDDDEISSDMICSLHKPQSFQKIFRRWDRRPYLEGFTETLSYILDVLRHS